MRTVSGHMHSISTSSRLNMLPARVELDAKLRRRLYRQKVAHKLNMTAVLCSNHTMHSKTGSSLRQPDQLLWGRASRTSTFQRAICCLCGAARQAVAAAHSQRVLLSGMGILACTCQATLVKTGRGSSRHSANASCDIHMLHGLAGTQLVGFDPPGAGCSKCHLACLTQPCCLHNGTAPSGMQPCCSTGKGLLGQPLLEQALSRRSSACLDGCCLKIAWSESHLEQRLAAPHLPVHPAAEGTAGAVLTSSTACTGARRVSQACRKTRQAAFLLASRLSGARWECGSVVLHSM